jgi:hypothetical protein
MPSRAPLPAAWCAHPAGPGGLLARGARLRQPAAGRVVGGHTDAGRVHQHAHLELGQIAFILGAAVLNHGHHAAGAIGTGLAGQARPQPTRPTVGHRHQGLAFDGPRTGNQRCGQRAIFPGQQPLQRRRGILQHFGHTLHQRLESCVATQDQAGLVIDQHAADAQLEPLRQFVFSTPRLLARIVFGRLVMPQRQTQGPRAGPGQIDQGDLEPALTALGVEQATAQRVLGVRLLRALSALFMAECAVVGRLQVDRVTAHQGRAGLAHQRGIGIVHIQQAVVGTLQRRRRWGGPQRAQQCGRGRRCAHARRHHPSSCRAAWRAVKTARLISPGPSMRASPCSRMSKTASFSMARSSSR